MRDGEIVGVASEERLSRLKNDAGYPRRAIDALLGELGLAPSILLLDEPFEGLAPVVVTRFIEAVKRIKALGISVLIAGSHTRGDEDPPWMT